MHNRQDLTDATLATVVDRVAAIELPQPRDLDEVIAHGQARRTRRRIGAALTSVIVAVAAIAIMLSNLPTSGAPRQAGLPGVGKSGAVLELASYRFDLPRGFAPKDSGCAGLSAPPSQAGSGVAIHNGQVTSPVTVLQSKRAAASAEGGCVELGLDAGANVVPTGAASIDVGSYRGYVVMGSDGTLTLYVTLACSTACQAVTDQSHYLVLASEGLTQQQLIAIASSGLPG
jgi:hypothetical protein